MAVIFILFFWERYRQSIIGKIFSKYCNITKKTKGVGEFQPPPPLPLSASPLHHSACLSKYSGVIYLFYITPYFIILITFFAVYLWFVY